MSLVRDLDTADSHVYSDGMRDFAKGARGTQVKNNEGDLRNNKITSAFSFEKRLFLVERRFLEAPVRTSAMHMYSVL